MSEKDRAFSGSTVFMLKMPYAIQDMEFEAALIKKYYGTIALDEVE